MIRQEQYEIWVQNNSSSKWDILGSFQDMDLASTVAKNHTGRTRLICLTFEYGKLISQESVAENWYLSRFADVSTTHHSEVGKAKLKNQTGNILNV